jgi:hypothetical protein
MKNKFAVVLAGLLLAGGIAYSDWVYHQNLVNESALAYNKTYTLNLNTVPNAVGISRVSAQTVYVEGTPSTASFTDGTKSTGSFTVSSVSGLVAVKASDHITVAATSVILAASATDQITVVSTSGLTNATIKFNNNVLRNGTDWFSTSTTSGTAASLLSALSRYHIIGLSRADSVIYATATLAGVGGNSFTLVSSTPTAISVAGATFSGGRAAKLTNTSLTVNGYVLKQGRDWFVADTSSGTATSLAAAVNHMTGISASATGSVVYATATVAGTAANAYTVVSSAPSYLTVSGATFSGGVDNAYVSINGTRLTQGTDWNKQSTASATAKAISDAIVANSTLNQIVVSTWNVSGVVSTTSTAMGTTTNYALASSMPSSISVSHPTMIGGTNSSYVINSPLITIPGHSLTTGLAVLYSSAGATTVAPLSNQTTYYAIALDSNDIELATTSTGAVAGLYITLTSSTTNGGHTFTLAPLAYSGTASFKWVGSNDGVNYDDINISSVTYSSPSSTAISQTWDFGTINYQYIGLQVVAPSTGGLNLVVTVNGKNL